MKPLPLYKSGEVCDRCGIEFKNRFKEWSNLCTVSYPAEVTGGAPEPAPGHIWNRNPIYA